MSRLRTSARTSKPKLDPALIFAALGDRRRLDLVARLQAGTRHSIVELSVNTDITRQAITKHLSALERAGVVRRVRNGRETQYFLQREPLEQAQTYLAQIAAQWDEALARLADFVEE
jgi:DNA-binding transcriptional ArsR family regulator